VGGATDQRRPPGQRQGALAWFVRLAALVAVLVAPGDAALRTKLATPERSAQVSALRAGAASNLGRRRSLRAASRVATTWRRRRVRRARVQRPRPLVGRRRSLIRLRTSRVRE
jgi:hypothetical protein